MRVLLLMRGLPGSGKSTFIRENDLAEYSLSADMVRKQMGYGVGAEWGKCERRYRDKVFSILFALLESRMERGLFTVIDNCNLTKRSLVGFKSLASRYRYRVFCVDFTETMSVEKCKLRNGLRSPEERVADAVIEKMAKSISPLPGYITRLEPTKEALESLQPIFDNSNYKSIKVFGDIHGCYTAFKQAVGELSDNTMYIFAGDYLDRGIENGLVLRWLLENYKRKNVLFLEGNHEKYLRAWSNDDGNAVLTKTFLNGTLPQIVAEGITKKDVRGFCRQLGQCAYFKYGNQTFFVNHAGVPTVPEGRLYLVPAEQMIEGVGAYSECYDIEKQFENTVADVVQIHGHRNFNGLSTKISERIYNLEGGVERGGEIRWVTLTKDVDGSVSIVADSVANDMVSSMYATSVPTLIEEFRVSPLIKERAEGHVSAFNFTRDAFNSRLWCDLTVRARGMFINTVTNEIVARAYTKFFNYEECPETQLSALTANLQFPLIGYVKEDGFLGILGYDKESDKLFAASKTTVRGRHARLFRQMLERSGVDLGAIKSFLRDTCSTLLFEVIDVDNDPHVIQYRQSRLVLLDIVKNTLSFEKEPYAVVQSFAKEFGFMCKKESIIFPSMQSLSIFLKQEGNKVMYGQLSGVYEEGAIEGYVLEDRAGFMFKYKTPYFRWLKQQKLKEVKHNDVGTVPNDEVPECMQPDIWYL